MNYVPDFVSRLLDGTIVRIPPKSTVLAMAIGVLAYLVLSYIPFIVQRSKIQQQQVPISVGGSIGAMVLAGSIGTCNLTVAVFVGILLAACETDCRSREVYNLLWIVAGVLWLVEWIQTMPVNVSVDTALVSSLGKSRLGVPWPPLFFGVLQQLFFCKFYGRADCHAFSCCGFYLWLQGEGLSTYLLQMLLALGLLGVVQLLRRNINSRGNLKRPVAFMPYITISFCTFVLF